MIDEPSLRQRWMGARLAALRHEADLSLQQASQAAERSTASLSRIENGLVALRPRDLRPLLNAYGTNEGDLRETLIAVAGEVQAERRGWWVEHDDDLSPSYRDLLRLESTATHIRTYETTVLPGLLQHEDYARAAVRATASADLSDDDLANFVAIRKQRQRILTREQNPVSFHAVVHEAALYEHLDAPAVMSAQAEYLRGLCDLPNVTVQLLPTAAGAHPALTGAFTVLSMSHLDFAHVELMTSDVYVEDPAAVRRYRDAFDALSQRALPPATSATAIPDKIGKTAESTPKTAR